MSDDIIDALAQIRIAFKKAMLEPPTTLLLASHDEGMRFLSAIRQTNVWVYQIGDPNLSKPIEMADGSVWMEAQVMGFIIRWPANLIATQDGTWRWT